MKINNKYIVAMVLMGMATAATPLMAQDYTPAALEQIKQIRIWTQTQNAAGMAFDNTEDYSTVSFVYDRASGNFHAPTSGKVEKNVGVDCEGYINLGTALVWGEFNFRQINKDEAGYNASIADPNRGMPYYVADDLLSDWNNQNYNLRFRAATPVVGKHWTFGVEGAYKAHLAAKQRDPRVDTRFYTLEVMPGIGFQASKNHRFGANFRYTSVKEDSRMSSASSSYDPTYYQMFGLGVAEMHIGSGFTTNYIGDRLGGAVQYSLVSGDFSVVVEGSYDRYSEVVQRSYSAPRNIAGVNEHHTCVMLTAVNFGNDFTNYFNASFSNRDMDGVQYVTQQYTTSDGETGWQEIFKNIRSTYKTKVAGAQYFLSRNRGIEYSWKVGASLRYVDRDDIYLQPQSTMDSENLTVKIDWKKNFFINEIRNARLLLETSFTYNNNLSGGYVYGGSHADYPTVTLLMNGESNYANSDYQAYHAGLTYSQLVRQGSKVNIFAGASYTYQHTKDWEYDKRAYLSIKLGCNF